MDRETSSIKVNDIASQIADNVGAAVDATNALPVGDRILTFHYNRRSPKRRRLIAPISLNSVSAVSNMSSTSVGEKIFDSVCTNVPSDANEGPASLSKMVAVLCEQQLFLPLLRAFEMFLPSCPLLPFIRALQVYELIQDPSFSSSGVYFSLVALLSFCGCLSLKARLILIHELPCSFGQVLSKWSGYSGALHLVILIIVIESGYKVFRQMSRVWLQLHDCHHK